jgi:hypothetical protein
VRVLENGALKRRQEIRQEELQNSYSEADIVKMMKSRRLRSVGLVEFRRKPRKACTVSLRIEGKGSFRRPRRTWDYNIGRRVDTGCFCSKQRKLMLCCERTMNFVVRQKKLKMSYLHEQIHLFSDLPSPCRPGIPSDSNRNDYRKH